MSQWSITKSRAAALGSGVSQPSRYTTLLIGESLSSNYFTGNVKSRHENHFTPTNQQNQLSPSGNSNTNPTNKEKWVQKALILKHMIQHGLSRKVWNVSCMIQSSIHLWQTYLCQVLTWRLRCVCLCVWCRVQTLYIHWSHCVTCTC